jgi:L-amino acid N-acyltransferase YncA
MTIRLADESDAAGILAIYGPIVRDTAISFELLPPSVEEMRERIRARLEGFPWIVCASGAEIWGYAYADCLRTRPAYRWTAEVTIYVHPERQRRGVARALYTSLLAALRLQGFRSAFGGIALPNPGSVALHEAMGFRPSGVFPAVGFKLGGWHDVGFWHLELQPLVKPTLPPRTPAELQGRPEWREALASGLGKLEDRQLPPSLRPS